MESTLCSATTRDGRPITVRRILAPDDKWSGVIQPFLGHKSDLWQWQLEQLLANKFGDLCFRSYLADLAPPGATPQIVSNICTFEAGDVGLFGHVYTLPAFRGQSIARVLTRTVTDDFRNRGGQALWLTTDYGATPYRVYREFGFDSILPEDGIMAWFAPGGQAELDRRFAPGQAVHIRPADWPDYATLNALSARPQGPPHRSTVLQVSGQNIVEWGFLNFRRHMNDHPGAAMNVLATERDWPVGWAVVQPDDNARFVPNRMDNPPIILDVYAHPGYEAEYPKLIESAALPPGRKVVSIIDSWCEARRAALESAGFAVEGRLTNMYHWQGRAVDLVFMCRGGSA
ncbi:MAG: GNAT family N-acetyltransferase [Phycisphaerae bacterium]|nr:GNAT family N-acetyltransferase [Phycisphaerae bacterium]